MSDLSQMLQQYQMSSDWAKPAFSTGWERANIERAMKEKMFRDEEMENFKNLTSRMFAEAQMKNADNYTKKYDADRYADKIAKADQVKKDQALLEDISLLKGFSSRLGKTGQEFKPGMTSQDTAALEFPEVYKALQTKNLQGVFGTGGNYQFTPELVTEALSMAERMHPELGKSARTELTQQGQTDRNQANIESRERIAQWASESRAEIAKQKASGQKQNLENLAAQYKGLADKEQDPVKKTELLQLYIEAKKGAADIKAAAATQGPQAKADAAVNTINELTRGRSGKIGDKSGGTPVQEGTGQFKVGDRRVKDRTTYERQANGIWTPVK